MTATGKQRRDRTAATRDRILEAARQLLLAEGVDGFSMRKLAARVGYTATAIYFHFPDKDALLTELVDSQFTAFRRTFDQFQAEPDPVERLRKMSIAYLDFALANPDHYRFMFLNPSLKTLPRGQSVERGNPAQDGYAFLKTIVAEGIAQGRYRAEYRDPDQLAQIIWASIHGLAALHIVKGGDPWIDWRPARPTAQLLVDAMLRGAMVDSLQSPTRRTPRERIPARRRTRA